uniref:Anaphase-promoting complex subunit 4 WD40 domain-containing protein n=1 Tax=Tetraselmis chuii TaxID=63592 RepID=A0A7S1X1M1_9CHLO|mmetsp:Transcript_21288/g.37909  ORF Transcript_21288/g.37909 Transcript_21288/m.37909 type:complete len:412 (+) Transcript_21288:142-1377(+)
MGDEIPDDEAYLADADGNVLDGVVVADLDEDDEPDQSDDNSSDGEDGGDGGSGPSHIPDGANDDDSLHSFEAHTDSVYAVAWSAKHPDLVATGGGDDMAFIWRVGEDAFEENHGHTLELAGHTDSVVALSFSSSGELLATGGMDGVVKIWDTSSGDLVQSLEGPGEAINWIEWHPKGDVVLAGSEDYSVWMWGARVGKCMQVLSGHSGSVNCGKFTPDGKAIVTGSQDGSLRAWNPKTAEATVTLQGHSPQGQAFHPEGLVSIAVSGDSQAALSGSEDGSVFISNIVSGRILGAMRGHEDSVESVDFSGFLPICASGSVDNTARIWDTATASSRLVLNHPQAVNKVICSEDSALMYSSCLDGVLRCWDIRTGTCVRELRGHTQGILDMAVSPDFSMVVTASDDRTSKMFRP